jgi:hypothetical protein
LIDWTVSLAEAVPQPISGVVLRLVESQEQVATNQLVSSLARQCVLEDLLEATKPAPRAGSSQLHYLLATPFRYPPLQWGSRFGKRHEPSLFYGALETRTVLCEAAYYRFLFWHGMSTPPQRKLDTQHTLFGAAFHTDHGLRLQDAPFIEQRASLTDPSNYLASQALGSQMRQAGVQAFEFISARDPQAGINVALFTPEALAANEPVTQTAWLCELSIEHVRFNAVHSKLMFEFQLDQFLIDGKLPQPAS